MNNDFLEIENSMKILSE